MPTILNVFVPAGDRRRLEGLARYVLRPPVAQDALEILSDGTVCLALRRPWRDGTCAILFSPVELIEKLAALVVRPRINLLIYHAAFAPHARIRRDAVASARAAAPGDGPRNAASCDHDCGESSLPAVRSAEAEARSSAAATGTSATPVAGVAPELAERAPGSAPAASSLPPPNPSRRARRHPHPSWAELLRHAWEVDVLACRDCGGRLRLVATIQDTAMVRRILAHLGLPTEVPQPAPSRAPPHPAGQLAFPEY